MNKNVFFEEIYKSKISGARVGLIHTEHGVIKTPGFVAVGTNGSLKAIDNVLLEKMELDLMFCNTYHLMLHPGEDLIQAAGGLHKFINRKKPIITDSGGFQVFSLAYGGVANELKSKGNKDSKNSVLKLTDDGVSFRSYRDGQKVFLSPEISIQAQKKIGADLIVVFDELPPFNISDQKLKYCLERTHSWEQRSLIEHKKNVGYQKLYAVIHGGVNRELRQYSCKVLGELGFDGYAIGGSLGQDLNDLNSVLSFTCPELDPSKPRHLLGIGDLAGIELGIKYGVDTFDSSYPTKIARHGCILLKNGSKIKISSSVYKSDFSKLDSTCNCYTCSNFTKAYLHHLFKAHEPTYLTLASIHNIQAMIDFMDKKRQMILLDQI